MDMMEQLARISDGNICGSTPNSRDYILALQHSLFRLHGWFCGLWPLPSFPFCYSRVQLADVVLMSPFPCRSRRHPLPSPTPYKGCSSS